MAGEYVIRGRADMSKHDANIKKSAAEVYQYKKQVEQAKKSIQTFTSSAGKSMGSFQNVSGALKGGNIKDFSKSLSSVIPQISSMTSASAGLTGGLSNLVAGASAAVVGIGAVGASVGAVVGKYAEFETHLADLRALTGLGADAMQELTDGAIEVSKATGQSASSVVDAMTIVGSKFPTLLKDTNGLIETTKNALVLSRAAGMDAGGAASALTTILNQFTLNAQASVDVINALAAASQAGSADIGYLTTAIEKSGSQAKSSGIDYIQLIAMIEAVAPYFSSADVAGTQLASTLLALAVQTNSEFTPSIQGAAQAFENLAKAELTDKEMKDLVGASNITMLRALIQTREEQQRLAGEITGTNTAYEQMQIKQETLSAKIQGLKNTWDNFLLSLGNTAVFGAVIDGIKDLIDWIDKLVDKSSVKLGGQEIIDKYRGHKKTAKEFAEDAQYSYTTQKKNLERYKSGRAARYKTEKANLISRGASQGELDKLLVDYSEDMARINKSLSTLEADRKNINKKIRLMNISELNEEVSKLEGMKKEYEKAGASQQSVDKINKQIKQKQAIINKLLGFQGGQSKTTSKTSNVKVPVSNNVKVPVSNVPAVNVATVKVKPDVQPMTSADIAKIAPPQGLPFKATPEIPQYSIKAINEKIASLRAELEVQPIASPRYKQLKKEIDDLEDKKHPVVIQPIVAPAKI